MEGGDDRQRERERGEESKVGQRIQEVRKSLAKNLDNSPLFTGDHTNLLTLSMWSHQSCLPPLIIRGINDVQNVTIRETESLTWQAAVTSPIIIKQGPETHER